MQLKERIRIGDINIDEHKEEFLEITTDDRRYMPKLHLSIISYENGVEVGKHIGSIQTDSFVKVARVISLMKKLVTE